MSKLRIALTKGRLENKTVELFEKMGLDCTAIRNKGRSLILHIPEPDIDVVLAKAADVITYVESGVCDMGVVGKDTIQECGSSFYELLDLGFGKCRFALASPGILAHSARKHLVEQRHMNSSKYTPGNCQISEFDHSPNPHIRRIR